MGQIFETVMLVCFGFSWPMNVIKAYKARTAKGTSLPFIILIITGYVAGITAKVLNGQFNYVFAVYIINIAIVFCNLIVYFRNVMLDRKALMTTAEEETKMNAYENELNRYAALNGLLKENGTILFGGTQAKNLSVGELKESFELEDVIYNRSFDGLEVSKAKDLYMSAVAPLAPESVLIQIGEADKERIMNDAVGFDRDFLELIEAIKNTNNARLTIISVPNPANNVNVGTLNRHLKNIAESANAQFIDLTDCERWNPKATMQAMDFARSMGLNYKPNGRTADYNLVKLLYGFENKTEESTNYKVGAAKPAHSYN